MTGRGWDKHVTSHPLTRAFAGRLMGWNCLSGGTTMKIRFFQATGLRISLGISLGICLAGALVTGVFAIPQNPHPNGSSAGEERKLAGTWRGDSLCVEKGTACHDELAVYRIAAIPGKPGYLVVTGGKVVDGKEIVMGSGEWRYDSTKHTLTVDLPRGFITLKADGNKLEGTFILPDKSVLRRIALKKSE